MDLQDWRQEVLSRLDDLETRAKQCRQYLEANKLPNLEDKSDFKDAWLRISEFFPEDFRPNRAGDLERHIAFAMPHDFSDIELHDIPAVRESVMRYQQRGEEFIQGQIDSLRLDAPVSDTMHPLIKDACIRFVRDRSYREAANAAIGVVMDELRRLSNEQGDGDALIRRTIGVQPGKLAFSPCTSDNEKNVTEGLKIIAQGLFKGVRNPLSHGWDGLGRQQAIQIMITCSFLLGQLQFVEDTN